MIVFLFLPTTVFVGQSNDKEEVNEYLVGWEKGIYYVGASIVQIKGNQDFEVG